MTDEPIMKVHFDGATGETVVRELNEEEYAQYEIDQADRSFDWVLLRARRDGLLSASDWTQLPDIPEAQRKAWAKYRQALRDLPANTNDPRTPDWPEVPA